MFSIQNRLFGLQLQYQDIFGLFFERFKSFFLILANKSKTVLIEHVLVLFLDEINQRLGISLSVESIQDGKVEFGDSFQEPLDSQFLHQIVRDYQIGKLIETLLKIVL